MGGRSRFGVTSWVLCLSILFVFSTTSNAQGLLGGGLPSLPLLGGCSGYSATCGSKARPGYASPALYVGWLYNRYGGNAFDVEFDQPVGGIFGVNHEFFTLSG